MQNKIINGNHDRSNCNEAFKTEICKSHTTKNIISCDMDENDLMCKAIYEELQAIYNTLEITKQQLQRKLEEETIINDSLIKIKERYNLVIDGSKDGIWDIDLKSGEHFYSDRCIEMLGYTRTEIKELFSSWKELIHPEDRVRFKNTAVDYLNKKIPEYNIEYRLRNKDGEYIWVASRGMAIWDKNNRAIRIAGSQTSIQARKRAEEEIYKIAYYDELTGLPNRAMFLKQLSVELEQAKFNNYKIALLSTDIDSFKSINDTLGHNNGDELLRIISKRIQKLINNDVFVARGGGDEFLILIKNVEDKNQVIDICSNFKEVFKQSINVNNVKFYATISIGASIYPEDGNDEYTLLKNADIAMYNAKDQCGNRFELFNNEMNLRIMEKLELENGLRNALKNDELRIYYQPQISIDSSEIIGLEALIRWQHPTKGLIPPLKFIPIAEEKGLIIEIGEWVLKKSFEQFIEWKKNNIELNRISINISAKQFEQINFVSVVKSIIEETGIDPKYIELEITESIAMNSLDYTIKVINELKELNIKVSLDDFGTGYSSLNYLMRLPINTLKLDKSFLDNIELNSNEELIAMTIITLAKKMNLDVVAEGVETSEQLKFLKEQSCDIAQGYLFSRPVPESNVREILKKKKIFI